EIVAANLDVGRVNARDVADCAAEHHVLARAFQEVVDDVEGAGAVPAADGLRVLPYVFEVGDVGVDDRGLAAVQSDAALEWRAWLAVHVAAIKGEMVRHKG